MPKIPKPEELLAELQLPAIDYGGQQVLKNVDLKLEYGELVYLLGSTGSGKSTLLKTLYGDLKPQAGKAQVAGFDLLNLGHRQRPLLRRKLGIIFQDFQLLNDRTVEKNLQFVLQATGWRNGQLMEKRIKQVLASVGLHDIEGRMPYTLSGGEQQRVVIARALLNEPLLILADEPTGNLDFEISLDIMRILATIAANGTGVVVATHDTRLAEHYPGRMLKIQDAMVEETLAGNTSR